jgi:uncharacterized membrane protein YdbT with pleckstrin-like domain
VAPFRLLLRPTEEVLVDIRPHWSFLWGPLVLALTALAVGISLDVALPHTSVGAHWVEGAVVAAGCVWLVLRVARWRRTGLVLTTERLIDQWGAGRRSRVEIPYDVIEQVVVDQGLLRSLAGTGTIEVLVWGEGPLHRIEDARKPVVLARIITRRLGPPPASA